MPLRRRFPVWILAAAVLGSVAGGKLARRGGVPDVPPPRTIHELRQLLQHCDPPLHGVEQSDLGEEAGVYFCARPQKREQLWRLPRTTEYAHLWKGVVFCTRDSKRASLPSDQLNGWGEYDLRVGDLLLFGDPALLASIRKATGQSRHAPGSAPS